MYHYGSRAMAYKSCRLQTDGIHIRATGTDITKQTGFVCFGGKDTLYGKILVQIKRIDEIKAENNKALLKERDSIKQLLTQIAHQLRTPLANMENYLVLLEEDGISEEERLKYINAVEKSERKISSLWKIHAERQTGKSDNTNT